MPSLPKKYADTATCGAFSYRFNRASIWRQGTERVVHLPSAAVSTAGRLLEGVREFCLPNRVGYALGNNTDLKCFLALLRPGPSKQWIPTGNTGFNTNMNGVELGPSSCFF